MNKEKTEKKQNKPAAAAASSKCLDLVDAATIVQECAKGPHNIDLTLERVKIITPNQRNLFRECVFNKVIAHGCQINRGDIPNETDTTLRQVIRAIEIAAT
jgi:hypothetical protein